MKKQLIFTLIFFAGLSFKGFSQAAMFSPQSSSGCTPMCVPFQDLSSNATSWLWDFGDATPPSTQQNPLHCYLTPGSFTVTLFVTFASGSGTATGTVLVYPNPIPAFTSANSGGNTVAFTDQSTNAVAWSWDFGDASAPSNLQNPTHTYATSGSYSVTLTATSSDGCTDTTTQTIIPTGIRDFDATNTNWTIYPNPSTGAISIHIDKTLKNAETIRVENMLGELILQQEISNDVLLDLSAQSPGIYFVRIGNSPAQKLVIE